MSNVIFKVDARTARLLGRENVVNENSAIIELVKNTYDADSDFCYLFFNINFDEVPRYIEYKRLYELFTEDEVNILNRYYVESIDKAGLMIKAGINTSEIQEIFLSKNSIICVDNGIGMDDTIIEDYWMKIGTGNKQKNQYSPEKNRVRTGAKGVGRFALDRLGSFSRMVTRANNKNAYEWELDWTQFENTTTLDQVSAKLEENKELNFEKQLKSLITQNNIKLENKYDYKRGTIIEISGLRDFWNSSKMDKLVNQIQTLFPFGTIDEFNIKIVLNSNTILDTNADSINNYDYKLKVQSVNGVATIEVIRNEFDGKVIPNSVFDNSLFGTQNYSKEEILGKPFTITNKNSEVAKFYKKDLDFDESYYNQIGDFKFEFYFMKIKKNDEHSYYYKNFAPTTRSKFLNTYGGIKLYRDNFRVRPYGEQDSTSFDWLGLGLRKAVSPSSISHSGKWKVAPAQVIGAIQISRLSNPLLVDQSNREGIMQNDYFYAFQQIILGIISIFETDRQVIVRTFRKEKEKLERNDAINVDDSISDAFQYESADSVDKKIIADNKKDNVEDYLKTISIMHKEIDKKNDQLRTLKAMGGTAVIANTFMHSLKDIKACIGSDPQQILSILRKYLNEDDFTENKVPEYKNPFIKVANMMGNHILLEKWIDLMVNSLVKDKRTIREINITAEIQKNIDLWKETLKQYGIKIKDINQLDMKLEISPMDINSIFNNLIANSVYALNHEESVGERYIEITAKIDGKELIIDYSNNGPELDKKYKENPNLIFEPGDTTKENGTGMGMWIIYNTIKDDYNGDILIDTNFSGFKLQLKIPY